MGFSEFIWFTLSEDGHEFWCEFDPYWDLVYTTKGGHTWTIDDYNDLSRMRWTANWHSAFDVKKVERLRDIGIIGDIRPPVQDTIEIAFEHDFELYDQTWKKRPRRVLDLNDRQPRRIYPNE